MGTMTHDVIQTIVKVGKKQVKFRCPDCGGTELWVVKKSVNYYPITYIGVSDPKTENEDDLEDHLELISGMASDDEEFSHCQCRLCGLEITNMDRTPVKTVKQLMEWFEWFKNHKKKRD